MHGIRRHIAGHFHLADFARKNEVHHAILRFLVGLQPGQNLARADIHFRQAPQAQNSIGDAARRHAVGAAHAEGDVGGGDHAPGHGFAMQQPTVAGLGFERVADRVAKVQHAAQAVLALVRGNDFRFQFHGLRDQPLQFHRIAFQNARAILLEAQKQFDVADDAALQRFVESGAKLAIRQRLQHRGIDQHHPRMMKRSHHVLAGNQIDSRLAADRSIHLRQHGRRNLHELDRRAYTARPAVR